VSCWATADEQRAAIALMIYLFSFLLHRLGRMNLRAKVPRGINHRVTETDDFYVSFLAWAVRLLRAS